MKNKLTYFITRFSMFGIGSFLMYQMAAKDAWLSVILGTLLGIIIIYIYKYIKEYFWDKQVKDVLNKTFLGKVFLWILIIFYVYLMVIILVLLPMFVNSFYLLYTPKILVVLPFLLLAVYITMKEKRVLESLSNLLFPFSIFIMVIYLAFLTKYVDFGNIVPILTEKPLSLIKAALIYASITSIPQIITINFTQNSFKDDLKNYLWASGTSLAMILITILSLGEPLIKIYSFPEYATLKQIKILKFIENIENLSTFIWYFDMFITLASLCTSIKESLPKKYRPLSYGGIITFVILAAVFGVASNYRIIIQSFYLYPLILGGFFLIFLGLLLYLKTSSKLKEQRKNS